MFNMEEKNTVWHNALALDCLDPARVNPLNYINLSMLNSTGWQPIDILMVWFTFLADISGIVK